MMTAKQHIQTLYAGKAKNDDYNSVTLANTLTKDIQTLFKGECKFIFELLQNADDASINQKFIDVEFTLFPNYLVFTHSGEHFSVEDVNKICDNAQQKDKSKVLSLNKIGYKGIGFKSIFSIASCVYIDSNHYTFRFDEDYFVWENASKDQPYPWPIIPIWTEREDFPKETHCFVDSNRVNFIIKLRKTIAIEDELLFIKNHPEIILFLRNINCIKVNIGVKNFVAKLIADKNNIKHLYINDLLHSSWMLHAYLIDIDQNIRAQLQLLNDFECPLKLKEAKQVNITFAAKWDSKLNAIETLDVTTNYLYCYLPTQVCFNLPYVVNAEFILNADRSSLLDNPWNVFLLEKIAYYNLFWLRELAQNVVLRNQILLLLGPVSIKSINNKFINSYKMGFQAGLNTIAFIPSQVQGTGLLKLFECIVDKIHFWEEFSDIKDNVYTPDKVVDYCLQGTELLGRLGCKIFDFDTLCKKLSLYAQKYSTPATNLKLLNYLAKIMLSTSQSDYIRLNSVPFVLSQSCQLIAPERLYFPNKGFDKLTEITKLDFVHEILSQQHIVEEWLRLIGVKELNKLEIVRSHLYMRIKEISIPKGEAISILQFIFDVFFSEEQNKLTKDDFKQLRDGMLVTKSGELIKAREGYLAKVYQPKIPLEDIGLNLTPLLISEDYIRPGDDVANWKKLFIMLKVSSIPVFKTIKYYPYRDAFLERGNKILSYLQNISWYNHSQPRKMDEHFFVNFIDFNMFDWMGNPHIYKAFWELFFKKWSDIKTYTSKAAYYCNKQTGVGVSSFLQYRLRTEKCIKASDGKFYCGKDVYAPHLEKILHGVFPVAKLGVDNSLCSEQEQFLGFKTSCSFDDSLSMLNVINKEAEINGLTLNRYIFVLKSLSCLKLSNQQKALLQKWDGKLIAENNSLQPVRKLYYLEITEEQRPIYSRLWLKSIFDETVPNSNENMRLICGFFNIPIVKMGQEKVIYKKLTAESLVTDLFFKAIFNSLIVFAVIDSVKRLVAPKDILLSWYSKLKQLNLIPAEEITIEWVSGDPNSWQKVYGYLNNGILYFVKDFKKPMAKSLLAEIIGRYLGFALSRIGGFKVILDMDILDIEEWLLDQGYSSKDLQRLRELQQQGFSGLSFNESKSVVTKEEVFFGKEPELPLSVTDCLDEGKHLFIEEVAPDKVEVGKVEFRTLDFRSGQQLFHSVSTILSNFTGQSSVGKKAVSFSSNDHVLKKGANSKSLENVDDIGRWGEALVYEKLKQHYRNKYKLGLYEETVNGFKISGVVSIISKIDVEVIWLNKNIESGGPADFVIIKNGVKRYIEVKSTIHEKHSEFKFSSQEWQLMFKEAKQHRVFLLFNAGKANGVQIKKIKDMAEKIKVGEIYPQSLSVKF